MSSSTQHLKEGQSVWVSVGRIWRAATIENVFNTCLTVRWKHTVDVDLVKSSDVKPLDVDKKRPRNQTISYKGKLLQKFKYYAFDFDVNSYRMIS